MKQNEQNGDTKIGLYASRFLIDANRFAINELKLIGALWGCEHFKHYLYSRKFLLETNHKA